MVQPKKLRFVILASGGGTTFQALVEAERKNQLHAHIAALIVDRDCPAIEKAKALEIPCVHVDYKSDREGFADHLAGLLTDINPDCVLLCGFLRKVPLEIIEKFKGRIFNSHPALLPRHGGAGLYGHKVHSAVFSSGDKETGVSFHHVTENYDEGPVVAQKRIAVTADDTAHSIEEKVKAIEKEFLIEQVNLLASNIK